MQCLNVENFGFNRCHSRKSNTFAIAQIYELMTYFTEVVDDDKIKRVKKRYLKPIEFLS